MYLTKDQYLGRWKENGIKEEHTGISNLMVMFYFLNKMVGHMSDPFIVTLYMVDIFCKFLVSAQYF